MSYVDQTQFRAPIPHYVPDHVWFAQSPEQAMPLDGLGVIDSSTQSVLTYGALIVAGLFLVSKISAPEPRANPRRRARRARKRR